MSKILIVDDHAVVRAGILQILSEETDLECVESSSAEQTFRLLQETNWDLVLLDLNLPDQSGIAVLDRIREFHPKVPVLILSMHAPDRYGLQVIRAGAKGYLPKEVLFDELIKAVRSVLRGERYLTQEIAALLLADPSIMGDSKLPHLSLSKRESAVFEHICQGKSLTAVADEMCISIKTASTYRARILAKMNMKTNADLIYYAVKQNLLPPGFEPASIQ